MNKVGKHLFRLFVTPDVKSHGYERFALSQAELDYPCICLHSQPRWVISVELCVACLGNHGKFSHYLLALQREKIIFSKAIN